MFLKIPLAIDNALTPALGKYAFPSSVYSHFYTKKKDKNKYRLSIRIFDRMLVTYPLNTHCVCQSI